MPFFFPQQRHDCLQLYFNSFMDVHSRCFIFSFSLKQSLVLLFVISLRTCFFSHLFLCFSLNSKYIRNGRVAKTGQSREDLHFLFVLCTALLIRSPIIYYLNPSISNKLKHSLCVYVNNTEKVWTLWEGEKKKNFEVGGKSIWCDTMVTPADDFRPICLSTICSRGFAIQAWSVINRSKHCVLCSLSISRLDA